MTTGRTPRAAAEAFWDLTQNGRIGGKEVEVPVLHSEHLGHGTSDVSVIKDTLRDEDLTESDTGLTLLFEGRFDLLLRRQAGRDQVRAERRLPPRRRQRRGGAPALGGLHRARHRTSAARRASCITTGLERSDRCRTSAWQGAAPPIAHRWSAMGN